MKNLFKISVLFFALILFACNKEYANQYQGATESVNPQTATVPVFDFDFEKRANFSVDTSSYPYPIESYTENGYTLNRRIEVPLALRPQLDTIQGVKFNNNAFSHLYKASAIPHRQVYFVLSSLESNVYHATNGNPFYLNKNSGTVGMLLGFKNTKGTYHFGFPSGTTAFTTNPAMDTKLPINNSNNSNPINAFRIVCITFPNSTFQNALALGAGSNATTLALRPWNGYIKRALFYENPLSTSEQDSLINALKNQYVNF